jgi:glycosyltransferase involved in cell wall biosynthesis
MQVHILSFEGPDAYARAGGIASRVTGLAEALVAAGCETHLWFIGDPELPGHEIRDGLRLHRWCQWISRYHPAGVYDGEEGKHADYVASLPPFLFREMLRPALQHGERAVILAEEWQTVHAVLHLDWLLRTSGLRERCPILWNANNTFVFDRIDWARLAQAAVITTVSRYMKQLMWGLGVDPLVLPNGLAAEAFLLPAPETMEAFHARVAGRTVLSKVARWDPDKRWLLAIETTDALKRQHWQPLLIARGGVEAHGAEVLTAAAGRGLRVVERPLAHPGVPGLLHALEDLQEVDVLSLRSPLDGDSCRVLFRGSAAVLANSGREPFGLVGLETMAVGGWPVRGRQVRTMWSLALTRWSWRPLIRRSLSASMGHSTTTRAENRPCGAPDGPRRSGMPGRRWCRRCCCRASGCWEERPTAGAAAWPRAACGLC